MDNEWGIILNPRSGDKSTRSKIDIIRKLAQRGINGELRHSKSQGHVTAMAMDMAKRGTTHFVVCGGDGTISEAIDGIMKAREETHLDYTIGLLPSGTGNDWARFWGIGKDTDKNIGILARGRKQRVDVGRLTYYEKRTQRVKYFINSVGLGFDAAIVARAEKIGKVVRGLSLNYALGLAACTLTHRSKRLRMETDRGDVLDDNVYTMSIANGPYTGGGIKQTPDADPRDGLLDIMAASSPGFFQLVKGIGDVLRHRPNNDVIRYYKAHKVQIESTHRHMVEADGIIMTNAKTPITVELIPMALTMIVP